jgi:hypothetical protein
LRKRHSKYLAKGETLLKAAYDYMNNAPPDLQI